MSRIITVTSGKGGVGKTSISLNLSLSLAAKGFSVCLFDADLGLANVNILTGIHPQKDLESVISGQHTLNEIMIRDYHGIDIIPGSSGVEKIAELTKTQTATLISNFLDIKDYDYFIFDTSAGISSQVLSFCLTSQEIILVVTDEPTSLTDAYSMLKVLSKNQYPHSVKVVLNRIKKGEIAKKAYLQLKKTAEKFLKISLEPLGIIADDQNVQRAVVRQKPFFISSPETVARKCILNIADKLIKDYNRVEDLPLELFWGRCISFFNQHQSRDSMVENTTDRPSAEQEAAASGNVPSASDTDSRLINIESRLSELFNEIHDLKTLINENFSNPSETGKSILIESWANTKRITPDSEADMIPVEQPESIFLHQQKKRREIIARGQLRNPTEEELANWNESRNPVIFSNGFLKRKTN